MRYRGLILTNSKQSKNQIKTKTRIEIPAPQEADHVLQRRQVPQGRQSWRRVAVRRRTGTEGPGGLLLAVAGGRSAYSLDQEEPHVGHRDDGDGGGNLEAEEEGKERG